MNTTSNTTTAPHTFRLSVVRTIAVGLLAGGAAVAVGGPLAGSASAGPILPPFPQITIPPQTTTTVKPKLPPFVTIPPVIVVDPTPPTVAPTTVPPTTATPTTVAPTTVAPKPPTTKKPTSTSGQSGSGTDGASADTIAPATDPAVAEPVVAVQPTDGQPTEEQVLAASGSDPIELGKDDSLPVLPIAGGALVAAAALVAGGLAYDKRRKA